MLNTYGRFALPAFTQVIMNVVMIVFALWLAPHTANPGVTLAIGRGSGLPCDQPDYPPFYPRWEDFTPHSDRSKIE